MPARMHMARDLSLVQPRHVEALEPRYLLSTVAATADDQTQTDDTNATIVQSSASAESEPSLFAVSQAPVASLTATPLGERTVLFDASQSSGAPAADSDHNGINTYIWMFGDGQIGYGETVTYTYDMPGQYQAALLVADGQGQYAWTFEQVDLSLSIAAAATAEDAHLGFTADAPTTYVKGSGERIKLKVIGGPAPGNTIDVAAWSRDLQRRIDPFQHQLASDPWIIKSKQLDKLPTGEIKIALRMTDADGESHFSKLWIEVVDGPNSSTQPQDDQPADVPETIESSAPELPDLSFKSDTTLRYRIGSDKAIFFEVDGKMPRNSEIMVSAYSQADQRTISKFTFTRDSDPWRLNTGKLDVLDLGLYTIHLQLFIGKQVVKTWDHELRILPPLTNTDNNNNDTGNNNNNNNNDTNPLPDDDLIPQNVFLGMNMSPLAFWSTQWAFVDVMKQAREWQGDSIKTDANGWPILKSGQTTFATVFVDSDGHYPAGNYVATWDGDGDVELSRDAAMVSSSSNRAVAKVKPSNSGIKIEITRSNPNNPVRNLQVWMPGFENAESSFHPLFVDRLEPFKVLRFMNWNDTNSADDQVNWSDRAKVDFATQTGGKGMAYEYMIELANELNADPWITIPHAASDEYVEKLARLFKNQLHKDATIYIEYSNEVWNTKFGQNDWVKDRATSGNTGWIERWAIEAKRDFQVWRDVWGAQADRVVRVAAGQTGNPWVTENLLEYMDGEFDAISSAAYTALEGDFSGGSGTSVNDLVASARRRLRDKTIDDYRAHGELAEEWSAKLGREIPYLAYEAGQHMTSKGKDVAYQDAMYAAQDSQQMYDLYLENLREFEKAGGSMFVAFNYVYPKTKFGSWGHLEFQDQPLDEAVKYNALIDYVS